MPKEGYAVAGISVASLLVISIVLWAMGDPWRVCEPIVETLDARSGAFMFFAASIPRAISVMMFAATAIMLFISDWDAGKRYLALAFLIMAVAFLSIGMWSEVHFCVNQEYVPYAH